MNAHQIAQWLLEGVYDYATVQLDVPSEIGDRIVEWGELNIPDDALYAEDGEDGREREQHITVLWGITQAEVPPAVYKIAHTTKPFPVLVGKVSLFRNDEFDVVKCEVESPELRRLNAQIRASVPNEQTHPDFNAHVTIAYVKRGSCDRLEGMDIFQDGDNEFVAYGMIFKGPGDGDDPTRVKEVLLFSKVKAHELVGAVNEGVVGPTRAEMRQVREIVRQAQQQCHGDPALFVELANDGLGRFGVRFEDHPMMVAGCPAMADENGIYLRPPGAHDLVDPHYADHCHALVYHELVHGWQMNGMDDPAAVADKATKYVMPDGRTINQDRYLQQKQEVMAFAASMVDAWIRQGLDSEQMFRRLKSGQWGLAEKYFYARKRFPGTFNRFCKYASEYINNYSSQGLHERVVKVARHLRLYDRI